MSNVPAVSPTVHRIADIRAAMAEAADDLLGDDDALSPFAEEGSFEDIYEGDPDWPSEDFWESIRPDGPGDDGAFITAPVGPDDEDAEWAARNLNADPNCHNVGWVEGEPDGSAIELHTVSAWDRHLDDLAADSAALEALERGLIFA